jgi:putative ABC transport system permease protein
MKLTRKLAYSQIKKNRGRSFWTLLGIALSTAMITAVFGFAASGDVMFRNHIGDNQFYIDMYIPMLYGVSAVFVTIIVLASVIVVSNSFRVSAGERISQFGILKSVGATTKQITEIIRYESIYFCAVGIPIGILLGLGVNLAGVHIVEYFLTAANALGGVSTFGLDFVIAWQAIVLSVLCSFATVSLSAWLPARKAAKIAAIDAIRGAGEVKINEKRVRANWLVKLLFGVEGTLASKSLKRSRRNFRATVVSLTVSVVLFIIVGTFGAMMNTMTTAFFPGIEANAMVYYYTSHHTTTSEDGTVTGRKYSSINNVVADEITAAFTEYPGAGIIGVGNDLHQFRADVELDMMSPRLKELWLLDSQPGVSYKSVSAILVVTDPETYAMICKRAGVPPGSNILLNQLTWHFMEGGRSVFAPLVFTNPGGGDNPTLKLANTYNYEEFELTLHGELTIGNIPNELLIASGIATVVVPQLDALNYSWFVTTDDAAGFLDYARAVIDDMPTFEVDVSRINFFNIDEESNALNDIGRLVMVFIYGFIIMLTLIGLTNVISTISTNVRSRSREFAILQSVGMTRGGLSRMLNLESILCSVKALIIGIPLGVLGSYVVFNFLSSPNAPVEFPFVIPWVPILQCTLGVLAVTWITMRYSASRLRGDSIVERIRLGGVG